jgi:predicted transcriptional regulator
MEEWGTGGLGIALLSRYCRGDPWTSLAELLSQTPLSRSQLRRRLHGLEAEGKVETMELGMVYYKASDTAAREGVDLIEALFSASK